MHQWRATPWPLPLSARDRLFFEVHTLDSSKSLRLHLERKNRKERKRLSHKPELQIEVSAMLSSIYQSSPCMNRDTSKACRLFLLLQSCSYRSSLLKLHDQCSIGLSIRKRKKKGKKKGVHKYAWLVIFLIVPPTWLSHFGLHLHFAWSCLLSHSFASWDSASFAQQHHS